MCPRSTRDQFCIIVSYYYVSNYSVGHTVHKMGHYFLDTQYKFSFKVYTANFANLSCVFILSTGQQDFKNNLISRCAQLP